MQQQETRKIKKPRTMKPEVWESMTPAVRRAYQRQKSEQIEKTCEVKDCLKCERFLECLWEEV